MGLFIHYALIGAPVFVAANVFFLFYFVIGTQRLPFTVLLMISMVAAIICGLLIDLLLGKLSVSPVNLAGLIMACVGVFLAQIQTSAPAS